VPSIEDFKLDAYGHLNFVVGFDDSDDEEPDEPLVVLAKAADMTEEEIEAIDEQTGPRSCGDWIACADYDRIGDHVGYHVVVNSDSGGFIDTLDQGVYTVEEARKHLPGLLETWDDVASENLVNSGDWFTDLETEENKKAIERWKAHLKEALA
jgi:hypothetical protein